MAYETSDGVYLSVDSVEGYGLLSHQSLDSLRAGARVEPGSEKRSPLDFALWKKAKPAEPTWPSPWGPGRPGWHTECVVMSVGILGEDFDLHGGALDLVFPHHENERAQAAALGRRFARHWVHNGFVTVEGEKMSKSLGNFSSIEEALSANDPRALRLLVLRSHYRSPMELTPANAADAGESLERLDALVRRFSLDPELARTPLAGSAGAGCDMEAVGSFSGAMDDDLDTPGALAGIFELVRAANVAADSGNDQRGRTLATTVAVLCGALGLQLASEEVVLDEEALRLVRMRDEARALRDWARADSIRDELASRGFVVEDGSGGTQLRRRRAQIGAKEQ
jgi:cysteinyl-tRNA synthetase